MKIYEKIFARLDELNISQTELSRRTGIANIYIDNGWYRYNSDFALPVYGDNGVIERYNVFHTSLIIRHANDGKMYLYDVIDIKKETSTPLEP